MSYTVKNAADLAEGDVLCMGIAGEIKHNEVTKLIRVPSVKCVAVQFDNGKSDILRYELQVSVVNK